MKDRADKSMGIVTTHITETSAKSKPVDPLRWTKLEAHKKRKCSDSSCNSPAKILGSRSGYKEISHVKSSWTRPEVLTSTDRKLMGSDLSMYI